MHDSINGSGVVERFVLFILEQNINGKYVYILLMFIDSNITQFQNVYKKITIKLIISL